MHSKMYLPYYEFDLIQKDITKTKNYYEYAALDFVCQKWNNGKIGKELYGNSFIDIGSNIGNHTLYFFNECQALSSYNFEPVKDTFNILKKNIELNNLSNKARLYNIALGCKKGSASLVYYDKSNIGMAQLTNDENGTFQILPLDDVDVQDNIKLIKIDVEGFELQVIQGMINTIKKYKPYIMIEIRNEHSVKINKILKELNYNMIEINKDASLVNNLYYPN